MVLVEQPGEPVGILGGGEPGDSMGQQGEQGICVEIPGAAPSGGGGSLRASSGSPEEDAGRSSWGRGGRRVDG
jgi:hypothetical protein